MMVQVISLREATLRRELVRKELDEAGIQFEFFDAHRENSVVFTEDLTEEEHREIAMFKLLFGRLAPLTSGEIGCASSHVALMRTFLNSDNDWLCVFEDDIEINDRAELVKIFHQASTGKLQGEFLYLGAFRRTIKPRWLNRTLITALGVFRILTHLHYFSKRPKSFIPFVLQSVRETYPWPRRIDRKWSKAGIHDGSHAYVVSRMAAKKLVHWNRRLNFRADELLAFAQYSQMLTMILPVTPIVSQRLELESQIGNDPKSRAL